MNLVLSLNSQDDVARYRFTLTGEKLGWVIYSSEETFRPVHRVLGDPEHGPVIIIGTDVFEVDTEGPVYATEDEAMDAYYAQPKEQGAEDE